MTEESWFSERNKRIVTILHAIKADCVTLVKYLLEQGDGLVSVDSTGFTTGETFLMTAVRQGNPETIKYLLEQKLLAGSSHAEEIESLIQRMALLVSREEDYQLGSSE